MKTSLMIACSIFVWAFLLAVSWKVGDAHGYNAGYEDGAHRDVFTVDKTESVRCWCQMIHSPKEAIWDIGGPPNLLWRPAGTGGKRQ